MLKMKRFKFKRKFVKISIFAVSIFFLSMTVNALRIYEYSESYFDVYSEVGIVLGAGTHNGKLSPVFTERVNHSIFLFKSGKISNIIFTGGFGKGEKISDSRAAANYAHEQGVPLSSIFIEENSTITFKNLESGKKIMDENGFKTALIISDPIHMKRAILMCNKLEIKCFPSPTQTSMYRTTQSKLKFLIYESFFFSIDLFRFHF